MRTRFYTAMNGFIGGALPRCDPSHSERIAHVISPRITDGVTQISYPHSSGDSDWTSTFVALLVMSGFELLASLRGTMGQMR